MTRKVLIKFALKRLSQEIVLGAGRPTALPSENVVAVDFRKRARAFIVITSDRRAPHCRAILTHEAAPVL